MKKIMMLSGIIICLCFLAKSKGSTQLKLDAIDTIKLTEKDIPDGYMYGKVPAVYRKTLKDNPWMMDRGAIKRLADKVYPGGDAGKISGMYLSIIANKKKPFNDDIVCYVILYSSMKAAQDELKKVKEFAGYNSDRVLILNRENLVVLFFVDDVTNFHYIQQLSAVMGDRIKNL